MSSLQNEETPSLAFAAHRIKRGAPRLSSFCPLVASQLVDARSDGKILEVGKMAPPFAPLDASRLLLFRLGRNIARMNRLLLQLLGEVQQQL